MNTKKKNILIVSITCVVLILLFLSSFLAGRIPPNDENAAGNTPGNLNNGGYFCEADGKVYFGNAYDNYTLYCMNSDETEIEKIGDNPVSSINVGGNYLYYAMQSNENGTGLGFMRKTAGIYRSRLSGKGTVCLDKCYIIAMQLCGNYLYYEKYDNRAGTSLEKIRTDKKEQQTIADYIVNPACYVDGRIYYNGTQNNHYLYALDTSTDRSDVLWEGNIWNPVYHNGYVYYMDVANNYRLCRYSLTDDVIEVLTDDRVDLFNIYDYYIFYQTSSKTEPALKRMYTDGSNAEIIREGVYQNINVTSQYVYFNSFDEPSPVYKTSTYGSVNVTTFDAAMEAALAEVN